MQTFSDLWISLNIYKVPKRYILYISLFYHFYTSKIKHTKLPIINNSRQEHISEVIPSRRHINFKALLCRSHAMRFVNNFIKLTDARFICITLS